MKNLHLIVKITMLCMGISAVVTLWMAMYDFWSFRWGWALVAFAVLAGTVIVELDMLYPDETSDAVLDSSFDADEFPEDYRKKDPPPPEEKIIVLTNTKCPHCGAPLDNPDRCDYCGTPTVLYKKIV